MAKTLSPLKAIRAKCLDCCCGSAFEVSGCTAGPQPNAEYPPCPLFPFRSGHNPNRKGLGGKNHGGLFKARKNVAEFGKKR